MSDHAVKVEPDHTTASSGDKDNVVVTEELVLDTSPAASLSPPVPSCVPSAAGVQGSATPLASKDKARSRSKMGRDDRSTEGKVNTDIGYAISTHVGKHLNRLRGEKVLQIKCAGRVMQGKQETNGNSTHQRPRDRHEPGNKHQRKKKPVTVDTSKAKTSLEALKMSIKQLKWKEFPLGRRAACDIYWHGTSFHDNDHIVSGQVNKFPGMIEMLKKINLSRALRTMHELFPEEYNFYPRSWILPDEYQQFSAQIRGLKDSDAAAHRTFIVKPDSGSQGEGIYLIREASEVRLAAGSQARQAVVQEYVQRPLLIDKLKFDIRLYVLVKALEPLQIYIAKEGLTRFCTEPYQEPNQKNLSHVFMHLTNYSLNVQSDNFVHSDSQSTGSKRTFSSVLYRLASKGVDIKKVWSDVISLVIKTVIALVPELKVHYQADIPPGKPGPTCFQILGFDILLTKNLKPVLLEVNSNPSMRIEHEQEPPPSSRGRWRGPTGHGHNDEGWPPGQGPGGGAGGRPAHAVPEAGLPQVHQAVPVPVPGGPHRHAFPALPGHQGQHAAGPHRLPHLHQVLQTEQLQPAHGVGGHPLHRHHAALGRLHAGLQRSRHGAAGVRGGLLPAGRAQVQGGPAAGPGGVPAGGVRGPPGRPAERAPRGGGGLLGGPALAEPRPGHGARGLQAVPFVVLLLLHHPSPAAMLPCGTAPRRQPRPAAAKVPARPAQDQPGELRGQASPGPAPIPSSRLAPERRVSETNSSCSGGARPLWPTGRPAVWFL
uniref:Tubulin tyrosine ligase-like family, member 11 n=1 Tax=Gadus morhua TaxID=8049 RepID=A0A8C5BG04_GADMO